ncbi:hypothetical protein, partial [Pseudomonas aeruginosa]|uniref:hypothetical protein n=1 Tax=Pseudomonas aeruginosa TaxID=287 RepID=UPI001968B216
SSSAASDVYKRQAKHNNSASADYLVRGIERAAEDGAQLVVLEPVSYTHLRAHETELHFVCRLLLAKKKTS